MGGQRGYIYLIRNDGVFPYKKIGIPLLVKYKFTDNIYNRWEDVFCYKKKRRLEGSSSTFENDI